MRLVIPAVVLAVALPAAAGVVVYLSAGTDIRGAVSRVVKAGGRVMMPVTDIGDPGFIALIQDTEGNVVGLHEARLPQTAATPAPAAT